MAALTLYLGLEREAMSDLTNEEAFRTMAMFLARFYERAGNDMETLLADITIESDGLTLDPAAWDDWIACVRIVKGLGSIPEDEM